MIQAATSWYDMIVWHFFGEFMMWWLYGNDGIIEKSSDMLLKKWVDKIQLLPNYQLFQPFFLPLCGWYGFQPIHRI